MKKFFFIIFVTVVTVLIFIKPKAALAASFSLSPAFSTVGVGNIFSVDIVLDTGTEAVSGATAILTYDTAKLSVQDDDGGAAGVQIRQGAIFNQTPLTNLVDATAGRIQYDSGSLGTTYTGRGTMATVHFRALAAGSAAVSFIFDTTSTANTSLVAAATGPTNVLTTVSNGTYTINTAIVAPPPVVLPPTGALENTVAALAAGIIFLGFGFVFARIL